MVVPRFCCCWWPVLSLGPSTTPACTGTVLSVTASPNAPASPMPTSTGSAASCAPTSTPVPNRSTCALSVYGVEQQIFNDREIAHMYDVKRLVRGTYWVAIGAAAWIVVVAATALRPNDGIHSNCRARGSVGRRRHRRQPVRIRIGGSHRVRTTLSALPPAQLRQRPVDSRPEHRLPTDNVPPAASGSTSTIRVALTAALGAVLLLAVGIAALLYRRWAASQRRPVSESASPASPAS